MTIPQLRIRTGYSFRNAYGRMPEVIEKLKAIGCESAGIVDSGTWGHVRWEQAMKKAELSPMFGMELPIINGDFKPVAWALADDTRRFYNLTTKCVRAGGLSAEDMISAQGVIRFTGGALDLPEAAYDYIDVNPSSIVHAHHAMELARRTGKPVVLTSYNDMPDPEHQAFAYSWEVRDSVGMRWIADENEMWSVLRKTMSSAEFDAALATTRAVADRLKGHSLARAPMIRYAGDLTALAREGQRSRIERGHIVEWTQEHEDRFNLEIEAIKAKQYDSYFLVVSDLIAYAKQHMLVGPGRGSSAGSLICYLLGITEVDPLEHDLLFFRFIDISRTDLPDIDIDFSDTKRHMVFDYLKDKYGSDNVCRIGSINTLKSLSVMAQVGKKFGIGIHDTSSIRNSLIEYSSADERYGKGLDDTLHSTESGKAFIARFPDAAECMGDLELHPSHSGVHAAGVIVCNDEVTDYCTVNADGIAQLDKPDAEYLNLLKIDALGLRTLGIIEDAGVISNEDLYALKWDEQEVFDILNDDKVSGIFQFEGDAVRSVMRSVNIDDFSKIDNVTALARPGPLGSGMAAKYIERAAGRAKIEYDVPQLEPYLKDTYGVFLYQEQIMMVVRDLGDFGWEDASAIRKAMSASKGEQYFNRWREMFIKGAIGHGVSEKDANLIWNEMVTFGMWGFNKSHSVSYAAITYWTCYLKKYFPLEFAAACLRTAKDEEQTIAILREITKEGVDYTAVDPDLSQVNWTVADGRLLGGILNVKGYGPVKALQYVQKREDGTLTDKDRERLLKSEVQYADLREAHTKWGHYYADPRLAGVTSGSDIIGMRECGDREECIVIAKLTKKVLSDENEQIRIKKRGGKKYPGQSQFLDLMMVDDSTDAAMRFRIRPEKYLDKGLPIAEGGMVGSWWLVKAWKISGIDMFIIKNIRALE